MLHAGGRRRVDGCHECLGTSVIKTWRRLAHGKKRTPRFYVSLELAIKKKIMSAVAETKPVNLKTVNIEPVHIKTVNIKTGEYKRS